MKIRGLKAALNGDKRYPFKAPASAVDYLVVGGGVVGLAIARRLTQKFPGKSIFLVERNSSAGQETSSRNSEVIHAGLYYPPGSLKTRLCLRGRELMYDYCKRNNIAHRKTGKLVVAQEHQIPYIETLYQKTQQLSWPPHSDSTRANEPVVPARLIDKDEAHALEPDLSSKIVGALLSTETGIVDSHSLMESYEKDITDGGGELVYSTKVVRVDPHAGSSQAEGHASEEAAEDGWVVQTVTGDAEEGDALLARTLINASGLAGPMILNALLPLEQRIPMYYAKGCYASYRGPGVSRVSHLIYPSVGTGRKLHGFQSLGTHLTLDLNGNIRFGPDIDWLNPPPLELQGDVEVADPDFWTDHLVADESRLPQMHEAITEYLEDIQLEGLQPDYCGIRPKLVGPEGGFQDFVFRTDYPGNFLSTAKRASRNGRSSSPMITLMGIESPGLTSSLAIAELVVDDMLGENGDHR